MSSPTVKGKEEKEILKKTLDKLNELYLMTGYMDKYGKDVWVTAILCVSFILLITHTNLTNVLDVVRADWPNQRCNPLFMPFAGYINKPTDKSNFDYTSDNFNTCILSILHYISELAFAPFQVAVNLIAQAIQMIIESVNSLRALFDKLRNEYAGLLEQIYAALVNLVVAFIGFVVKVKDTMKKTSGVLTTALYTLMGSYMAMESLFLSIIDLLLLILIIIACMIIVFIAITLALIFIPFFGQALASPWVVSTIITTVIMIAILIPVVWLQIMMLRVLDLSTPPPPSVPGCFAGDTLIPLFAEGEKKPIKDIKLGDKLQNGGIVTATIQFSSRKQNIYNLNEVIVTGEHRVFHPTMKWIKVKNHPDARLVSNFIEPYVYCLNTDNKDFIIADTIFSDWDDIDDKVVTDLQNNCVPHGYLPENFTYADIHTSLDSGFLPDTMITLKDGSIIPISDININDNLENDISEFGAKVLGIIKIQGNGMEIYKHSFENGTFLCGTKNSHINDPVLGIVNCMSLQNERIPSTPVLYHLLTDTKFFIANNIKVNDYNYGIDVYLI
jgi:hypothetical protein